MSRLSTLFLFVIGKKTYAKYSIKMFNLKYKNKNFYELLTK